jgi:hypothetical protein
MFNKRKHASNYADSDNSDDNFDESDGEIKVVKKVKTTGVKNSKQQKKAKGPRIRNSNLVWTFNTNQRIGPYEERLEPYCEKFNECMNELYNNIQEYVIFLEPGHEWSRKYIKRVECKTYIERGEKFDQIHGHNFVGIAHYSKIHLDRAAMKEFVCKYMGLENIYMSRIKVFRNSTSADLENWLAYARKNNKGEK